MAEIFWQAEKIFPAPIIYISFDDLQDEFKYTLRTCFLVSGDNHYNLYVYGTTIYGNLLYWLIGFTFLFFDLTNKPVCIRRYKIQPGTNEPVDRHRLYKVLMQVAFNECIVGLVMAMNGFKMLEARGLPDIRTLPTFQRVVIDLAVYIILREVTFYYFHRLLHHKMIYKYIHKRHHEWTSPIALTSAYCHPIEHVICNIVPIFIGPLVMGSHLATMWIGLLSVTSETMVAHSGYHLPFLPGSPEGHDYHHLKWVEK
jgi:fatty acid hydroxylase domain-containing protein 2